MSKLPKKIKDAIESFSALPGIGPKSAARIVFYLLSKPDQFVEGIGEAVGELKKDLKICSVCYNYGESDPCDVCADENRDESVICVVEEPLDVSAIERANYKGLYHVLGAAISPINGISADDIRVAELLERINKNCDKIKEVIFATNPSLEGEATAVYIAERLKDYDIKLTRLARGLPVGGDLEYADEVTLSRSLEGRSNI
jgi:recombination protein RecR